MRSFIIRSESNRFPDDDIKTGVLHITVEFKEYFASESGELSMEYEKVSKTVKFEYREAKSHRLSIGRAIHDQSGTYFFKQAKVPRGCAEEILPD